MRTTKIGLVWLAVPLLACGGDDDDDDGVTDPPPPEPVAHAGWLDVRLTQTPNSNDGIMVFSISGGAIDSVGRAAASLQWSTLGNTPVRLIAYGNLRENMLLARVWVPDRRHAYTVNITEVAASSAAGYTLRETLAGYVVDARRAP